MGLLDALFPSSDGGGLLDFLKQNASASIANNPGTMASDTAQYGAPPMPPPYQPGQVQAAPIAAPGAAPSGWNSPWPQDNMQWPQGPIGAPGQPAAPAQSSALALAPQGAQPAPQLGLPPQQDASPLSGVQNFFNRTADALGSISRGGSMLGAVRGQFDDPRSQAAAQSNMTARALVAKGVDPQIAIAAVQPGNTEMLKTLVDQRFGAPKPPTALGSGYIYNPQTNKVERAYEPEDKIPAGFAKGDDGNMHFIPGGPADPAVIAATKAAEAKGDLAPGSTKIMGTGAAMVKIGPDGKPEVLFKNERSGTGSRILSDDGADLMADRIINGEKGVTTGFARSPADLADIYNRVAAKAKERNIDASDILSNINNEYAAASASRTFGGMTAKQETYGAQTAKAIDIAEKASLDVPRSNYPDVNKAILAYRNHTGDPKVAALGQAIETLTQEYARAVGGGHGTVADKEEAREYLSKAQSHDQLVARLNVMRQEIARARESVGESASSVGQIYRGNIRGAVKLPEPGAAATATGATTAAPLSPGAYVWSPDGTVKPK